MICDTLAKSEAARISAWTTLQKIRQILQLSAVDRIPSPSPKSFQEEGRILLAELTRQTLETDRSRKAQEEAVVAIRPFITNSSNSGEFAHALMNLNRAMDSNHNWLNDDTIRKLRALAKS